MDDQPNSTEDINKLSADNFETTTRDSLLHRLIEPTLAITFFTFVTYLSGYVYINNYIGTIGIDVRHLSLTFEDYKPYAINAFALLIFYIPVAWFSFRKIDYTDSSIRSVFIENLFLLPLLAPYFFLDMSIITYGSDPFPSLPKWVNTFSVWSNKHVYKIVPAIGILSVISFSMLRISIAKNLLSLSKPNRILIVFLGFFFFSAQTATMLGRWEAKLVLSGTNNLYFVELYSNTLPPEFRKKPMQLLFKSSSMTYFARISDLKKRNQLIIGVPNQNIDFLAFKKTKE